MISCHHHHTRFSSNTATECLFVCLVCKSRSRSHPPRKTHRAIKVCKFCSDIMVAKYLHMKSFQAFSLKQPGLWGHGSLWVTCSSPIHHMAESGSQAEYELPEVTSHLFTIWQSQAEYELPEAHKLPLTCSPHGRVGGSSWAVWLLVLHY